jgi:hypothetical protein
MGLLAVAMAFSSCTMEKRLYSSGFHLQWNTKATASAPVKNNKSNPREQATDQVIAGDANIKPTMHTAVLSDESNNQSGVLSNFGSPNDRSATIEQAIHLGWTKSARCEDTRGVQKNAPALPKPLPGETMEQLAQRKANVARDYEILGLVTLIIPYLALIFFTISWILKKQVRSLTPDHKDIKAIPKLRPGETVEQLAKRKANKSLLFGIISIPTTLFVVGSCFAILAIILGRDAKKLAPDNQQIQQRAQAGINWGVFGVILISLILIWLFLVLGGDIFI